MDFSAFLKSLEDSGLANSLRGSLYYFPFLESVHVMALAVVFGTILVVDLRALGIASTHRPFTRMSTELLRITWGAFAVSALTGSMMFITNARVYAHNTSFRVKMVLLALAGINMAVFHLTAGRSVATLGPGAGGAESRPDHRRRVARAVAGHHSRGPRDWFHDHRRAGQGSAGLDREFRRFPEQRPGKRACQCARTRPIMGE